MPKKDALIMYVPSINRAVLNLIEKYPQADIYVWGDSLKARGGRSLQKNIHAITSEEARRILSSFLSRPVYILEYLALTDIATRYHTVIMPNDDISHDFLRPMLFAHEATSIVYDEIFLFWDKRSSKKSLAVTPDRIIQASQLRVAFEEAHSIAKLSSDFWRHIGAVIFDANGKVIQSAYNHHMPDSYAPYTMGDPRGSFSKGVGIGYSTAIHAEASAISLAAKQGKAIAGQNMYVTTFPCPNCAYMIVESGIHTLYYLEGYSMLDGEGIVRGAGIEIVKVIPF